MSLTAALLALALIGSADDPDAVVATAPTGAGHVPDAPMAAAEPDAPPPEDLTTEEQIDRWLAAGREADRMEAERRAADRDLYADTSLAGLPSYDRRTHVEAGVAVGSHGYQAYYGSVTAPLGENATISFSYSESKGGFPDYRHVDPYADSAPLPRRR